MDLYADSKLSMKKNFFVIFALSLFCVIGCSKNQNKTENLENTIPLEIKNQNHTWYTFTQSGFEKVSKPQNALQTPFTPWTEAKRISCSNTTANQTENAKAYAIVNRLGILEFNDDKIFFTKDVSLFSDRTAGNLVFLNDVPIFSVYKSAFFNDTITDSSYKMNNENHLFLIQYDQNAKICYPIINCNNLTKEINSEVTDFFWDGLNWICSIKTISDVKNSFSYINWKPTISLLNLSPTTAESNIVITESSQDEFRDSKKQISYENAPERVKKLLSGFDKSKNFLIEIKSAGGTSPKIYSNQISRDNEVLNAKAIISQSWSAALFEDGTLFLEGALPGKHILREGKPIAIRLPKLPAGYMYTDFVISQSTLYAAWEETSFYKTARSGFLQVDFNKTLYEKL